MSHQEQIDPSRMISGRLTSSVRRARQNTHIPKRGRGKGRSPIGVSRKERRHGGWLHAMVWTGVSPSDFATYFGISFETSK